MAEQNRSKLETIAELTEPLACAPIDLWNKTFGRWVKKGSKGIALIDKTGSEPRLKYVFDIADTLRDGTMLGRHKGKHLFQFIIQKRPCQHF